MSEIFVYSALGFFILSLGGIGYFTIWRLTDQTHTASNQTYKKTEETAFTMSQAMQAFETVKQVILGLDKRLIDLETEIKLQKSDSSRLVEWLDKESKSRDLERTEFLKALKITERESKIVELGERLKLITKK